MFILKSWRARKHSSLHLLGSLLEDLEKYRWALRKSPAGKSGLRPVQAGKYDLTRGREAERAPFCLLCPVMSLLSLFCSPLAMTSLAVHLLLISFSYENSPPCRLTSKYHSIQCTILAMGRRERMESRLEGPQKGRKKPCTRTKHVAYSKMYKTCRWKEGDGDDLMVHSNSY